jgi:hypothetical protein
MISQFILFKMVLLKSFTQMLKTKMIEMLLKDLKIIAFLAKFLFFLDCLEKLRLVVLIYLLYIKLKDKIF